MIVVDTGPLYAVADRTDAHHAASVALLDAGDEPLVVPITVVVETSFLIERHLGPRAEAAFLRSLGTSQRVIDRLVDADFDRIADPVATYHDMPLGTVDASVVSVAERLGAIKVATVDRRHFTVVRPRHVNAFTLLP